VESFILHRRDNSAVLVWRSRLPLSESEDEAPAREIFISGVGRGSCLVNQEQPFLPCFVFLGSGITFMCLSHHHHRLIFVYARGESLVFFSVEKTACSVMEWEGVAARTLLILRENKGWEHCAATFPLNERPVFALRMMKRAPSPQPR